MNYEFANRFNQIEPSMIRSVLVEAAGEDMINFSPGFPDKEAFPLEAINRISKQIFKEHPYDILQYARGTTLPELKEALIAYFNQNRELYQPTDDLMVTSGSGEGLEMAAKVFLNSGDVMVCEDPTFLGALNGFKSNDARIIGVPLESDGLNLALLEKAFQSNPKPKLLYVIPTFQNPTTICTSLEKRKAIYELCVRYNIIILEDNPYEALRFKGEAISTFKELDTKGIVVYLSSLSKIISPGLRVGVVIANREIIQHFNTLKAASAGAVNNFSQWLMAYFFKNEDLNQHLSHLQSIYQKKSDWMLSCMKKYFHKSVKIHEPTGGMFIWFELPSSVDSQLFLKEAIKKHIALVPEIAFAIDKERPCQGFRLSYTSESLENIEKGIQILGELTHQLCA